MTKSILIRRFACHYLAIYASIHHLKTPLDTDDRMRATFEFFKAMTSTELELSHLVGFTASDIVLDGVTDADLVDELADRYRRSHKLRRLRKTFRPALLDRIRRLLDGDDGAASVAPTK